uniref:Uncharacterized protein n=1 Tax=Tanacetum cinerariifolium TaxID=118510 RepID=A0A6L2KBD4_TANCI|nr:hypothetical protein [Tanacetum cinerariifolium]
MKPTRKDIQVPQPSGPTEFIADEAVHKELGDRLVRAATTASSLKAEQDSGNITKIQYKATPSEPSSQGTDSTGGPSDKDSLKLDELMALCTTLQNKVLDMEKTTTTQRNEITSLKRRVKKLAKKNRSRTHRLKRLYKVGLTARVESSGDEESLGEDASKQGRRIDAIDADEKITLVSVQDEVVSTDADKEMFDIDVLGGEEMFVAWQNENVVEEVVDVAQEDLEDLYKLVKARYGSTRLVESIDYLLKSDMKTMFEPHVEDKVWKMQQGYKVLEWKLYDSCIVHSLMMQSMQIYMLVEKKSSPLRIDLSHTGLPEFVEPSVKSYRVKPIEVVTQKSSVKIFAPVRENNGAPVIEE